MQLLRRLNQTGDTIVEVFICMAIVSFALGAAYGITRESLVRVRVAEERSQSLKIAEQQVQRIKQYIASNPTTAFADFNAYPLLGNCLLAGPPIIRMTSMPGQTTAVTDPNDARCAVNQNGTFDFDDGTFTGGIGDPLFPYRAGYTYNDTTHTFYVFAGRLKAGGNNTGNLTGVDVVTLIYRALP